jgi:sugar phosphate permease
MRESPWTNASGADASQDAAGRPAGHAIRSFSSNVIITLANPVLWLLAVALGMLNACRYGFMDWGLTQLVEVQATGIDKAGFKYAVLPIGGIAGAYFSGWATDRIFGGRRAPVICGLLVTLGLLTLGYNWCIHFGTGLTIITLLAIGFSMFGAQVILVGTAPIDLARAGTAAAAVGFVNFMGYIGAFSGDQVTGYLAEHYDWKVAVYFWASCAFLAAAMVALLWNATAQAGEPLTDQAGDLETARP